MENETNVAFEGVSFHYSIKNFGACEKTATFALVNMVKPTNSKEKNVPLGIPRLAYRHEA